MEAFDGWQYLGYLRNRWRFIAVTCVIAASVAVVLSVVLPKRFSATSRILIEPPAGTDLHSAMAVSPIYLESLKTYEHFASSDSLFARALSEFHIRERLGNGTAESMKRNILQVSIPRDTKILEVRVTLPDAKLAQALAQYVAEETVRMNRSVTREEDRELLESVEKQYARARAVRDEVDAAWSRMLSREPVAELQAEIESQQALRSQLQRQLLASEMDAAEYSDRSKHPEDVRAADLGGWLAGARVRIEVLRKQLRDAESGLTRNRQLIADRKARMSKLEADRKSADASLTLVENRLEQVRGAAGYRGERLRIIDPGVVPERPSFPNLPLNAMGAIAIGIVASILYLTLEFGYRRRRVLGFNAGLSEAAVRRANG